MIMNGVLYGKIIWKPTDNTDHIVLLFIVIYFLCRCINIVI